MLFAANTWPGWDTLQFLTDWALTVCILLVIGIVGSVIGMIASLGALVRSVTRS